MAQRNFYYVDFEGGSSAVNDLDSAKLVAERRAREYGYARVTCARTEHGKILNQKLVYEAGQRPAEPKGWLSSRVPWLAS